MKLHRARYDFGAALDALLAQFPECWEYISDMRMYSAIGRDARKLRFASHAKPIIDRMRTHCEMRVQLERSAVRR